MKRINYLEKQKKKKNNKIYTNKINKLYLKNLKRWNRKFFTVMLNKNRLFKKHNNLRENFINFNKNVRNNDKSSKILKPNKISWIMLTKCINPYNNKTKTNLFK